MDKYKTLVRDDFSKAAKIYDRYADLQKKIAYQLVLDNKNIINTAHTILDIGCGTGYVGSKIKEIYPHKNIIQSDISNQMALLAQESNSLPTIVADMENLPFNYNSIDMVISSLAAQWGNLDHILVAIKNILKPSGRILLNTITNNSFAEIKEIFPDLKFEPTLSKEQIQEICTKSNIDNLHVTTYSINQILPSLKDFFKIIKNIGAGNKNHKHTPYLGKTFFSDIEQKYKPAFPNKIPYTIKWEIALVTNL